MVCPDIPFGYRFVHFKYQYSPFMHKVALFGSVAPNLVAIIRLSTAIGYKEFNITLSFVKTWDAVIIFC